MWSYTGTYATKTYMHINVTCNHMMELYWYIRNQNLHAHRCYMQSHDGAILVHTQPKTTCTSMLHVITWWSYTGTYATKNYMHINVTCNHMMELYWYIRNQNLHAHRCYMQSHDANALCKHTLENTQIDSGIYSHFCVGLELTTATLVYVRKCTTYETLKHQFY